MPLVTLVFAFALSFQDANSEHIDDLVKELSSASLGTALSAERELRTIGEEALPALKEAAKDDDEERARRAKELIREIEGRAGEKEARTQTRFTMLYKDLARGIAFEMKPDGTVTLRAPADGRKGEIKTWTAKSPEEFREKHPQLVEKYGLDGVLAGGDVDAEFERMRADLERLMEARAKRWRAQERAPQAIAKPSFGVMVTDVPEALQSQLKIGDGHGVLILDVSEDGLAAKTGIERHDIIQTVDGKTVEGVGDFATKVGDALGRDQFRIKVLRGGAPKELTVTSSPAAK